MNLDYVSKIKFGLKRYKTIATDKATSRVLDGSYNSIYKGRSMNFDVQLPSIKKTVNECCQ